MIFYIERVKGIENKTEGYFVTKSNVLPQLDPIKGLFTMIANIQNDSLGEKYKIKNTDEKIFCKTKKEVEDYINYQFGEF